MPKKRIRFYPEEWTRGEAEGMAAHYASTHAATIEVSNEDERLKEALRRWLQLNEASSLIDGETGLGVQFGPPSRKTTWDVEHMPDEIVLALARRGLLTVLTPAFDALLAGAGSPELDAAKRFRIDGENAAPLQVVTP